MKAHVKRYLPRKSWDEQWRLQVLALRDRDLHFHLDDILTNIGLSAARTCLVIANGSLAFRHIVSVVPPANHDTTLTTFGNSFPPDNRSQELS